MRLSRACGLKSLDFPRFCRHLSACVCKLRKDGYDAQDSPGSPEFRRDAVAIVRSGRTVKDVAGALGVSEQSLRNCVKQDGLDQRERDDGITSTEREELRELRRKVKRLEQERDLLKRAAAFFAKETDGR